MPTNSEVDAARIERQRRAADAREAEQPRPRTAQGRRDERIAAAHQAATARNRWRCMVEECPTYGQWVPANTKQAALSAADTHYARHHYRPDAPQVGNVGPVR